MPTSAAGLASLPVKIKTPASRATKLKLIIDRTQKRLLQATDGTEIENLQQGIDELHKLLAEELILLKVKDRKGSVMQFRVGKSSPLRKLMDVYSNRIGLQAARVRFTWLGVPIDPDDSPEKLGLEDEGLIDATTSSPTAY